MANELSAAHERYARLFVRQRIHDVFNRIDRNQDGCIDEHELFEYLENLGYPATKTQVRDMVWEVDDKSEGYLTLDAITSLLKRLQKASTRGVGTGSNLLRNLFEYMIFDTDFSGAIDVEEVQQMFFVYYGFKGGLLDQTVRNFQKLRPDPAEEILFYEFSNLMDQLSLKPALQERVAAAPKRRRIMPKLCRTPRGLSYHRPSAILHGTIPIIRAPHAPLGARSPRGTLVSAGGALTSRSAVEDPSCRMRINLPLSPGASMSQQTDRVMAREADHARRREQRYKQLSTNFMSEYEQYRVQLKLAAAQEKEVSCSGMRLGNI